MISKITFWVLVIIICQEKKSNNEKVMYYDYLIVGTGLFGSIFVYEANKIEKKCLVIEKRNHVGGNIYILKLLKELIFINMVLIYFIQVIKMYGII